MEVSSVGERCTYHEIVPQNESGEKKRCSQIKSNGEQCGNKTANASGLCYAHD